LRGFRGLQVDAVEEIFASLPEFQSPCGVLGVCRLSILILSGIDRPSFSPLAGF